MQKDILDFQDRIFTVVIIVSWVFYISFLTGISISAPKYLEIFDYYVKIYVSLFLLFRFNPFTKIKFTELDRKIAFSAGIFLFTTTSLNHFLINKLVTVKNIIIDKTK
jgi:hypothetical protein